MTVLTFFIIISMTLNIEQGVEVQLPNNTQAPSVQATPKPLLAKLALQGLTIEDQPVTKQQAVEQIKAYLGQTPKGAVVLQASPDVPYEQVVALLGELRAVGGDRVLLAIE